MQVNRQVFHLIDLVDNYQSSILYFSTMYLRVKLDGLPQVMHPLIVHFPTKSPFT
jgi:hypothetical protein